MNRKLLLLTVSTCLLCVGLSFVSGVNAIPSNYRVLDRKMSAKPASSNRIEVVRRFIQAVEAKDISTVNQLTTDNIVLEQPYSPLQPGGLRLEGRQAANAFFNRIFSQYSQIRFVDVVIRQSQFDNAVILEGQGDFRVSSNPSPYRNQYIGVLEVVDGRIARIREYFNPLIQPEPSNPGSSQPNQ
jgi:uncharacterized protein